MTSVYLRDTFEVGMCTPLISDSSYTDEFSSDDYFRKSSSGKLEQHASFLNISNMHRFHSEMDFELSKQLSSWSVIYSSHYTLADLFSVALYRLLCHVEYRVSISVQRHSLTFLSAIKATTGSP
jgi:hypothetical protein